MVLPSGMSAAGYSWQKPSISGEAAHGPGNFPLDVYPPGFPAVSSPAAPGNRALSDWFREGQFAPAGGIGGFEIEAWLVDRQGQPAPLNQVFLERLANPLVVPELSVFNIELNTPPLPLRGDALRRMHANLESLWRDCQRVAAELDAAVVLIGILPTLRHQDLDPEHMSGQQRYRAINDQILQRRRGQPMELAIHGTKPCA